MRRGIVTAGALALGLAVLTAGPLPAAAAPPGPGARQPADPLRDAGLTRAPKTAPGAAPRGANPYLSLLPAPARADVAGWARRLDARGAARAKARAAADARRAAPPAVVVDEDEPDGTRGSNDTPATAQLVDGFGTGAGQFPRLRLLGSLDPEPVDVAVLPASPEDDGAIPLARDTGIGTTRSGAEVTAEIGDGPHGSAAGGTGDVDVYALRATAGETVRVRTATPTGGLDTVVVLYDAAGTVLGLSDDTAGSFDSDLSVRAPATGVYYAAVNGYPALLQDPFDPASGTGASSEGPYTVTLTAAEDDVDVFGVQLRPGDVVGSTVKGSATELTVFDPDGREVHGSRQDASGIYPAASPLPGGGNAVTDHVATRAGWHYVGVRGGAGGYDITVEAYRPALEGAPPTQTLFLDFDGARVNTSIFGGGGGVKQLSPFSAFVARWGLTNADRDALIDAITDEVRENLERDLVASGLNTRFRLAVTNSKDAPDTFGQANVSRIVVGGTIAESGIATIGIAQSIDPGNFETEETALVLLDLLSEQAGESYSINTYLTAASDRRGFVAQTIGNVVAHEAGHFFGNWHTDQFDALPNLQDQGGNFPVLYGVGPDGVGGTADDVDVDFGEDRFVPSEGFTGVEDTLGRVVFGVTS